MYKHCKRKGKIVRDSNGGLRDRVRVKLDTWVPKFYDHWGIAQYFGLHLYNHDRNSNACFVLL